MNELTMQTRWVRAAQMIFMATALSGSAACNLISGANAMEFNETNVEGNGGGGEGGGSSGEVMIAGSPTSSVSSGPALGSAIDMSGQIRCKGKDVMVAVNGRSGSWIDSVSVICAEIRSDGTMGTPYQSTAYGGPDGGSTYIAACQPKQAVVELRYKHAVNASYAYKVGVGCATFSDGKISSMVSYTSPYDGGIISDGEEKLLGRCNPGQVAAGMDVSVNQHHVSSFDSLFCIPAP